MCIFGRLLCVNVVDCEDIIWKEINYPLSGARGYTDSHKIKIKSLFMTGHVHTEDNK